MLNVRRKLAALLGICLCSVLLPGASVQSARQGSGNSEHPASKIPKGRRETLAAIRGMGGLQALRNVRSLSVLSSSKQPSPQGDFSVTTRVSTLGFRQLRQDVVSPFGEVSLVFDGRRAWQITKDDTRELSGNDLQQLRARLARSLALLLPEIHDGKRRVARVTPVGESEHEADELLITDGAGSRIRLTIARDTGYVLKVVYQTISVGGERVEEEELRSDFRPVGDLVLPFRLVVRRDGKTLKEISVHDYEINRRMPPSLFVPAVRP